MKQFVLFTCSGNPQHLHSLQLSLSLYLSLSCSYDTLQDLIIVLCNNWRVWKNTPIIKKKKNNNMKFLNIQTNKNFRISRRGIKLL